MPPGCPVGPHVEMSDDDKYQVNRDFRKNVKEHAKRIPKPQEILWEFPTLPKELPEDVYMHIYTGCDGDPIDLLIDARTIERAADGVPMRARPSSSVSSASSSQLAPMQSMQFMMHSRWRQTMQASPSLTPAPTPAQKQTFPLLALPPIAEPKQEDKKPEQGEKQ